jgi:hypothetical protein
MWETFADICMHKNRYRKTELTKVAITQESWLPMVKMRWSNWHLPKVAILEYFQRVKLYLIVCMAKQVKGKVKLLRLEGKLKEQE